MSTCFEETVKNYNKYLRTAGHTYSARLEGDDIGGISLKHADECTYIVITKIDEKLGTASMEVSFNIRCLKDAETLVSEYISKINVLCEQHSFKVAENGYLYISIMENFCKEPISKERFELMENTSVRLLDEFKDVLAKLCNLRLPNEDEMEPRKILLGQQNKTLCSTIGGKGLRRRPLPPAFNNWNSKDKNSKEEAFTDEEISPKAFYSLMEKADEIAEDNKKSLLDDLLLIPEEDLLDFELPDIISEDDEN